jgi:hypothetical protein
MHAPEYSLKLSRPFAYCSAAFSIVVVGNQIADLACLPGQVDNVVLCARDPALEGHIRRATS